MFRDNFSSLYNEILESYRIYFESALSVKPETNLSNLVKNIGSDYISIYKCGKNYNIINDPIGEGCREVARIIDGDQYSAFHISSSRQERENMLHLFRYKINSEIGETLSNLTVEILSDKIIKLYNVLKGRRENIVVYAPQSKSKFNSGVADNLKKQNIDVQLFYKRETKDIAPEEIFPIENAEEENFLKWNVNRLYTLYYKLINGETVHTDKNSIKLQDILDANIGFKNSKDFSRDNVLRDLKCLYDYCIENEIIEKLDDVDSETGEIKDSLLTHFDGSVREVPKKNNIVQEVISPYWYNYISDIISPSFNFFKPVNSSKYDAVIVYDDNISSGFTSERIDMLFEGNKLFKMFGITILGHFSRDSFENSTTIPDAIAGENKKNKSQIEEFLKPDPKKVLEIQYGIEQRMSGDTIETKGKQHIDFIKKIYFPNTSDDLSDPIKTLLRYLNVNILNESHSQIPPEVVKAIEELRPHYSSSKKLDINSAEAKEACGLFGIKEASTLSELMNKLFKKVEDKKPEQPKTTETSSQSEPPKTVTIRNNNAILMNVEELAQLLGVKAFFITGILNKNKIFKTRYDNLSVIEVLTAMKGYGVKTVHVRETGMNVNIENELYRLEQQAARDKYMNKPNTSRR